MSPLDVGQFHFLRPYWLLAILLAVGIALIAHRTRPRSRWHDVIDPALLPAMLQPGDRSSTRRLPWLFAFALACAALVLAGPTWQRLPQAVEQRSDALVLMLDLSLSMYAADVAPSRLVRARHKLADVLRRRDEGYTALVVYAGDAHTVTPLTDDVATIENLLGALDPAIMPVLGSNLAEAIGLAHALLDSAHVGAGRILLVTDGIDSLGELTAQCVSGRPLSILGVGTPRGAPIPLDSAGQPGRELTDRSGRRVIARLDDVRLDEAARLCGGTYRRLSVGDADIEALLRDTTPVGVPATEATERKFDLWVDAGQYLTLALLPLALLGFRRGVLVGVLLTVAVPADAGFWDDLWQRRDQQGRAALRDGEPERAAQLFEDPQWQGVARYRSGSFEDAARDFAANASAAGHYNRGNALARQGRFPEAIAAYDDALARDPTDEDAAYNKALIERLLEEQQSGGGQPNEGAPDGSESQQSQSEAGDSSDDQQAEAPSARDETGSKQEDGEDGTPDQDREDSHPRPDSEEATAQTEPQRDAQQDALDQWLRRIPDDPGGLLRRKFQYESNQRMRQGRYPDRSEGRIW